MVELRSGITTGGQNPSTPDVRDPNIPDNIEIAGQGDQNVNQGAQVQDPSQQQGQTPAAAQGVYVGGTYPATLTRAAQGKPSYRPPQLHSQLHQLDSHKRNKNQLSHMRMMMVQNLQNRYQHQGGLLHLKHQ